jgi:hypothetical protein
VDLLGVRAEYSAEDWCRHSSIRGIGLPRSW